MFQVTTHIQAGGEVEEVSLTQVHDTLDLHEVESTFNLMWAYVDDHGHGFVKAEITTESGLPVGTVEPVKDELPWDTYSITFGDDESLADYVNMAMGEAMYSTLLMGLGEDFVLNITVEA